MAKLLKKEGTEWISCFPAQTLIEACSQEGIRPVLCRQERAGVNMADAYSRIHNGNKIGVFTMQHGPGAENAFGGVAQAYADNVPMLLIPGGSTERRVGVQAKDLAGNGGRRSVAASSSRGPAPPEVGRS